MQGAFLENCGLVLFVKQGNINNTSDRSLSILIIGGCRNFPGDREKVEKYGKKLGRELGSSPHKVFVCSCHESSLDRYVLRGISETASEVPGKVAIFRPVDNRKFPEGGTIKEQWDEFLKRTPLQLEKSAINPIQGPPLDVEGGFSNAFLLCQLKANEEC